MELSEAGLEEQEVLADMAEEDEEEQEEQDEEPEEGEENEKALDILGFLHISSEKRRLRSHRSRQEPKRHLARRRATRFGRWKRSSMFLAILIHFDPFAAWAGHAH